MWSNCAFKIVEEWKYLACKIYPAKDFGVWISLHTCFANTALLKTSKSLNPRPPWFLETPRTYHFLQWIPETFFELLHHKFDIEEAISLQVFLGRANKLMMYVGIA